MIAHCLFEQSGTFKNEFKKLGFEAYDYDILNEYGQTDYQIDLFEEIRGGYEGKASIFDRMNTDDIILAFFPCTRFECQVQLYFRGLADGQKKWSDLQKLEFSMGLHEELHRNYLLISKLAIICIKKNLKLIIENPITQPHYLTLYWCLQPKVVDKDRTLNGDYMKKPTQYFFINCEPKNNILFEPIEYVPMRNHERLKVTDKSRQTLRSEMHPQYARRFIKQYLIDYETDINALLTGAI